jgi:tRNA pseudouridine55 synthase
VRPDEAAIRAALPSFVGEIQQVPPQYSAVKVEGERAYDLARAGEEVELQPRQVVVYEAELVGSEGEDLAHFRIRSGKGFYIRALVRDLAAKLGAEGHVWRLRRTAVGPFTEAESVTPTGMVDVRMTQDHGVDPPHRERYTVALLVEPRTLDLAAIEQHTLAAHDE